MLLLPKVFKSESAGELAFHLDLKFPDEVNAVTVCRDFHVEQSDVRLFVHDSAAYMVAAAGRLKLQRVILIACLYLASPTCLPRCQKWCLTVAALLS